MTAAASPAAGLGVSDDLAIIDVMCVRPPLKASYKRWQKPLAQIMSWDRFDPAAHMTDADIDAWIRTTRHKAMYRDEVRIDWPAPAGRTESSA